MRHAGNEITQSQQGADADTDQHHAIGCAAHREHHQGGQFQALAPQHLAHQHLHPAPEGGAVAEQEEKRQYGDNEKRKAAGDEDGGALRHPRQGRGIDAREAVGDRTFAYHVGAPPIGDGVADQRQLVHIVGHHAAAMIRIAQPDHQPVQFAAHLYRAQQQRQNEHQGDCDGENQRRDIAAPFDRQRQVETLIERPGGNRQHHRPAQRREKGAENIKAQCEDNPRQHKASTLLRRPIGQKTPHYQACRIARATYSFFAFGETGGIIRRHRRTACFPKHFPSVLAWLR